MAEASSNPPAPTARERVLSIPELVEAILLALDSATLSVSKFVCRAWRDIINRSPALQREYTITPEPYLGQRRRRRMAFCCWDRDRGPLAAFRRWLRRRTRSTPRVLTPTTLDDPNHPLSMELSEILKLNDRARRLEVCPWEVWEEEGYYNWNDEGDEEMAGGSGGGSGGGEEEVEEEDVFDEEMSDEEVLFGLEACL
ncbi:hypothetical protein BO78DRAFT_390508 [Aspergillus sclerotiicarbonarius CBS 121057]|uniref:F-box domain-containing protein n=1 Tax=Aspergillus sclerotiicarbonarius (strain CBS 121057 / IBT 28362) TaxID=1448318 RepID=A0A319E1J3_ASPSB|nr:hypothetical protein BO78DRAFT_390508 [Aspergillus sclerotiicarbonarius CBS 121057]